MNPAASDNPAVNPESAPAGATPEPAATANPSGVPNPGATPGANTASAPPPHSSDATEALNIIQNFLTVTKLVLFDTGTVGYTFDRDKDFVLSVGNKPALSQKGWPEKSSTAGPFINFNMLSKALFNKLKRDPRGTPGDNKAAWARYIQTEPPSKVDVDEFVKDLSSSGSYKQDLMARIDNSISDDYVVLPCFVRLLDKPLTFFVFEGTKQITLGEGDVINVSKSITPLSLGTDKPNISAKGVDQFLQFLYWLALGAGDDNRADPIWADLGTSLKDHKLSGSKCRVFATLLGKDGQFKTWNKQKSSNRSSSIRKKTS